MTFVKGEEDDGGGSTTPTGPAGGDLAGTYPNPTVANLSILTTIGDLLYESGTGVVSRLGIGTTGQVLTVAGGIPTWAPSVQTAADCIVELGTNYSLATGVLTALPWTTNIDDPLSMHSTITNNTRITIPANGAGIYLVGANITPISALASSRLFIGLAKNGSVTQYNAEVDVVAGGSQFPGPAISGIMRLAVGDYMEANGYQTSGGSVALSNAGSGFWLCRLGL